MPIQSQRSDERTFTVAPSAALELMWLLHYGQADHVHEGLLESQEAVRIAHGQALTAFWDDQVRGFTEMVVLAERSGSLRGLEIDGFFAGLERAATSSAATPSLLSETPGEREAVARRLEILRTDSKRRARYGGLLKDVWSQVRVEWEETGRAAVAGAVHEWQRRAGEGVPFRDLLQRSRLWPGRPELDELADADAAKGRLVLSPGWFFGDIHVVELDGTMYAGRGIRIRDEEADRRHVAKHVSGTLKAFADPTRLAILLWIARRPASVTEIARHFKLSQPTVSGHVHVLREAGVLDEKQVGRSAKLSATEQGIRQVFAETEERLVSHLRHQRSPR